MTRFPGVSSARPPAQGTQAEVAAIVLTTSYAPEGWLFQEEGKFDPKGIVRGPWGAYYMIPLPASVAAVGQRGQAPP